MSTAAAELYQDRYEAIQRYVDILASRGIERGLIGPRETPRLWDRHILNCAVLGGLIPAASTVVDVGSGAGLPGVPVAVLRPDLTITLLEPLERRAAFLAEVVEELDLTARVTVVRGRAEEHHQSYDVVTARAVAPLGRLVGWCTPLVRAGGQILALKGRSAADELVRDGSAVRHAGMSAEVLELASPVGGEATWVVRIRSFGSNRS